MKPIIYLFNDTLLFIGKLPPNAMHSIPVDTLSTNVLDSFFATDAEGNSLSVKSVFWPSGEPRQTDYGEDAVLAFLVYPKYLVLADAVQQSMLRSWGNRGVLYELKQEQRWADFLNETYTNRPSATLVKQQMNSILELKGDADLFTVKSHSLDPRALEVIRLVKQEVVFDRKVDLAEAIGVSPQHLRRLFKKEVGNSISQYKTHLKMCMAVLLKARGKSLTETAVAAGFYDLSHVDKLHKKSYGVSATNTISISDLIIDDDIVNMSYLLGDSDRASDDDASSVVNVGNSKDH